MNIWVGTSGYNYPEWRGTFYPPKFAATKMLPFYAEHFTTVEINNTFYRAPNEKVLRDWSAATPEGFKLTLKAPKRLTHDARLRDCADLTRYFFDTAAKLGPKLGVLLFQLPLQARRGWEGPTVRAGAAGCAGEAALRGTRPVDVRSKIPSTGSGRTEIGISVRGMKGSTSSVVSSNGTWFPGRRAHVASPCGLRGQNPATPAFAGVTNRGATL